MASKKNQDPNLRLATCSKCETKAIAVVGKRHRRCRGTPGAGILAKKAMKHPKSKRGIWK